MSNKGNQKSINKHILKTESLINKEKYIKMTNELIIQTIFKFFFLLLLMENSNFHTHRKYVMFVDAYEDISYKRLHFERKS